MPDPSRVSAALRPLEGKVSTSRRAFLLLFPLRSACLLLSPFEGFAALRAVGDPRRASSQVLLSDLPFEGLRPLEGKVSTSRRAGLRPPSLRAVYDRSKGISFPFKAVASNPFRCTLLKLSISPKYSRTVVLFKNVYVLDNI